MASYLNNMTATQIHSIDYNDLKLLDELTIDQLPDTKNMTWNEAKQVFLTKLMLCLVSYHHREIIFNTLIKKQLINVSYIKSFIDDIVITDTNDLEILSLLTIEPIHQSDIDMMSCDELYGLLMNYRMIEIIAMDHRIKIFEMLKNKNPD